MVNDDGARRYGGGRWTVVLVVVGLLFLLAGWRTEGWIGAGCLVVSLVVLVIAAAGARQGAGNGSQERDEDSGDGTDRG